ncbi:protein DEHYDRATION-INDUCED 19 homolog 4-like [Prosopis cineraria]|uniref:protein DEHYDRATION-INDUCED 19 homolog 4-like n=1 Tax=Prosopis cineraria TaxID=364024 RepID=UPI00240F8ABF|nr:protein DEHYDRATION-INDUCED 19 homolog 4-like [Prosopis cineraria]XP_054790819.1 protein DEHYDRATION-INDUCED 19 homolog 4-like [Prosopis cineraria]
MDSDSWISARLSTSSRRYQSRSDHPCLGGIDDTDGDDDFRAEYLCPFCGDEYDVLGLCCHIDEEHPVEANTGICPVCAKKVGMDLVGHITMQHRNFLKAHHKRRYRRGGSGSAFSLLRKGALQSLFGGSSYAAPSNSTPDPLLSSFIHNSVVADESLSLMSCPSVEANPVRDGSKDDLLERKPQESQSSEEDKMEKARRYEFIQGLLSSTILED